MNNNEISEDYQSTPNPAKMSKTSNTEISKRIYFYDNKMKFKFLNISLFRRIYKVSL